MGIGAVASSNAGPFQLRALPADGKAGGIHVQHERISEYDDTPAQKHRV